MTQAGRSTRVTASCCASATKGLVTTVRLDRDTVVVALAKEGRGLLESRQRGGDSGARQSFHDGVQRPRELKHDAQLYRAYLHEAEQLHDQDARIVRVVLENDPKSEYQQFLHDRQSQPKRQ